MFDYYPGIRAYLGSLCYGASALTTRQGKHQLADYTYAKYEPSEHVGSGEMSIGANCVKIRICRKIADY
jgi:hypothetical protein